MIPPRQRKGFWIGIVLSLFFLWLVFRKVNFGELGTALKSANYWWILVALLLSTIIFIPRAYRWQFILNPIKHTRFGNAFGATTIGFMANSVLPARLGEIVRAFVIGYSEGISKSASFATIVVERVFDMFILLFFFFGLLIAFPFPEVLKKAATWALVVTFIALGFLVFLKKYPNYALKLLNFLPKKIEIPLKSFLASFVAGLEILKDWKTILWIFVQSIFIWSLVAVVYYILFYAFNLELSIGAAFIIMIISCFGVMIPSSPGFIGTYHYFAVLGLSAFGVSKDIALSAAIVGHIVGFLPVVLIGLVCLQKLGLSLRKATKL